MYYPVYHCPARKKAVFFAFCGGEGQWLSLIHILNLDRNHFMVISPDEGALNRNMYYASVLGVNLGMFYKRRDYSRVVNGRNPIVAHEYLGESVENKDVFVADDIISVSYTHLDVYKRQARGREFEPHPGRHLLL